MQGFWQKLLFFHFCFVVLAAGPVLVVVDSDNKDLEYRMKKDGSMAEGFNGTGKVVIREGPYGDILIVYSKVGVLDRKLTLPKATLKLANTIASDSMRYVYETMPGRYGYLSEIWLRTAGESVRLIVKIDDAFYDPGNLPERANEQELYARMAKKANELELELLAKPQMIELKTQTEKVSTKNGNGNWWGRFPVDVIDVYVNKVYGLEVRVVPTNQRGEDEATLYTVWPELVKEARPASEHAALVKVGPTHIVDDEKYLPQFGLDRERTIDATSWDGDTGNYRVLIQKAYSVPLEHRCASMLSKL